MAFLKSLVCLVALAAGIKVDTGNDALKPAEIPLNESGVKKLTASPEGKNFSRLTGIGLTDLIKLLKDLGGAAQNATTMDTLKDAAGKVKDSAKKWAAEQEAALAKMTSLPDNTNNVAVAKAIDEYMQQLSLSTATHRQEIVDIWEQTKKELPGTLGLSIGTLDDLIVVKDAPPKMETLNNITAEELCAHCPEYLEGLDKDKIKLDKKVEGLNSTKQVIDMAQMYVPNVGGSVVSTLSELIDAGYLEFMLQSEQFSKNGEAMPLMLKAKMGCVGGIFDQNMTDESGAPRAAGQRLLASALALLSVAWLIR